VGGRLSRKARKGESRTKKKKNRRRKENPPKKTPKKKTSGKVKGAFFWEPSSTESSRLKRDSVEKGFEKEVKRIIPFPGRKGEGWG